MWPVRSTRPATSKPRSLAVSTRRPTSYKAARFAVRPHRVILDDAMWPVRSTRPQPASRGIWQCRREAPHGLQGREQRAAARREIWVGRSGRSSASDTNLRQGTSLARPGPRTFLVAVNRGASRGVGRTHETHRDLMWPDLTVSTRRPTVYVWIATLLQRDSGTTHVPYRR